MLQRNNLHIIGRQSVHFLLRACASGARQPQTNMSHGHNFYCKPVARALLLVSILHQHATKPHVEAKKSHAAADRPRMVMPFIYNLDISFWANPFLRLIVPCVL
jgi:hypothetical protein